MYESALTGANLSCSHIKRQAHSDKGILCALKEQEQLRSDYRSGANAPARKKKKVDPLVALKNDLDEDLEEEDEVDEAAEYARKPSVLYGGEEHILQFEPAGAEIPGDGCPVPKFAAWTELTTGIGQAKGSSAGTTITGPALVGGSSLSHPHDCSWVFNIDGMNSSARLDFFPHLKISGPALLVPPIGPSMEFW